MSLKDRINRLEGAAKGENLLQPALIWRTNIETRETAEAAYQREHGFPHDGKITVRVHRIPQGRPQ